jgi:PleD family two-component response regulator
MDKCNHVSVETRRASGALACDRLGCAGRCHGVPDEHAPPAETPPPPSRRPLLLLADDDELSRKLLAASLQRSGFEVEVADDDLAAIVLRKR